MTEVSKSRRGFLGLMATIPLAGPALAKAAIASTDLRVAYAAKLSVDSLSAITADIGDMVVRKPGFYFSKPGVDALSAGWHECIVYDGEFTQPIKFKIGSSFEELCARISAEEISNRLAGAYINEDGDAV
ncbi:hypothetical protein [Bradyrhizobium prioriisuperbiae]|uniref:hypothetical protein n=1 Tax=Bradyrhizobium prioriisuperbiae TaxID=2854389 RepID=UPI0028E82F00|nr:hypothetical protein [Bradyrhizobium prioritasuperba]